MTALPSIAAQLADALRNRRCECHNKELWPWKRVEMCTRCLALSTYDLMVAQAAIIQTPTVEEHASNVQLSALMNRIEQDGWARLDRDDLGWLKKAMRP